MESSMKCVTLKLAKSDIDDVQVNFRKIVAFSNQTFYNKVYVMRN